MKLYNKCNSNKYTRGNFSSRRRHHRSELRFMISWLRIYIHTESSVIINKINALKFK